AGKARMTFTAIRIRLGYRAFAVCEQGSSRLVLADTSNTFVWSNGHIAFSSNQTPGRNDSLSRKQIQGDPPQHQPPISSRTSAHHSTRSFSFIVRGPKGCSGTISPKLGAVTGCPCTPLVHVCRLSRLKTSAPNRNRRLSRMLNDLKTDTASSSRPHCRP